VRSKLSTLVAVGAAALLAAGCSSGSAKPAAPATSTQSGLPQVTASGATAHSLWQVSGLVDHAVADGAVTGFTRSDNRWSIDSVSVADGKPMWAVALPVAQPEPIGLISSDGVVIAEVGHSSHSRSGGTTASDFIIVNARDGHPLWTAPIDGTWGRPAFVVSRGLFVTGDRLGRLSARKVRTGAIVWRRPRPVSCHQVGQLQYDEGLAADGSLMVASYQCLNHGIYSTLVQRLAVSNGTPIWQWTTPRVVPGEMDWLTVDAVAQSGNVVLLGGQIPPNAFKFAAALPRPSTSPSILGPVGNEVLVALDGDSGRPRWTEVGAQQEQISLTDGAVCESVSAGFECRDDVSGAPTRSVYSSGYDETAISAYGPQDVAAMSGDTVGEVKPSSSTHSVAVLLIPLRRDAVVATLKLDIATVTSDGSRYSTMVVSSTPLPNGETLLLVRRVDLPSYPLLALSVASRS
jgi:hypothetical protein